MRAIRLFLVFMTGPGPKNEAIFRLENGYQSLFPSRALFPIHAALRLEVARPCPERGVVLRAAAAQLVSRPQSASVSNMERESPTVTSTGIWSIVCCELRPPAVN